MSRYDELEILKMERAVIETSCRYRESIFTLVRSANTPEWTQVCEDKFAAERAWDKAVDELVEARKVAQQ